MLVTLGGMLTPVTPAQNAKASEPMATTGLPSISAGIATAPTADTG
jgi:hypothetical protein